jgi:hypothetical protein
MSSIDGEVYSVDISGGERAVGQQHVADADTPLVAAGKRSMETATFNCVFSDTAAEAYRLVRGYHETAGGGMAAKWAPEGSASGSYVFSTGTGICTECLPPAGNVEDGQPIMFSFTVACAVISTEVLA